MFAKNIFNFIIKTLIMNKFIVFFFLILNFQVFSQLIVSTKYVEGYIWDENNSKWGDVFFENERYAFLEFNEELTSMTFTSFDTKTNYYISNLKHDDEYDHYTYDIVSEEGFESILIVDLKAKVPNVRFLMDIDESTVLVRHTVKYWFDYEE